MSAAGPLRRFCEKVSHGRMKSFETRESPSPTQVDLRSIGMNKWWNNVVNNLFDNDFEIDNSWSSTVTRDRGSPMSFRENSCGFGDGGGPGLASSSGATNKVSHRLRRNADRGWWSTLWKFEDINTSSSDRCAS